MKIFLFLSIISIAIVLIGRRIIYSAKRNLFKDQAAWSGKDIRIKYKTSKEVSESKESNNYLKIIADESKIFLDDQPEKDNE